VRQNLVQVRPELITVLQVAVLEEESAIDCLHSRCVPLAVRRSRQKINDDSNYHVLFLAQPTRSST
jgi:hypothetical protein